MKQWYWITALIIFIIILTIIIYYLSIRFPGTCIPWRDSHKWCKELGKPFLSESEINDIHDKVKTDDKIRWVNDTLGTIGVAAYIDTPYTNTVESSNLYMLARYNIYSKLIEHLESRLGKKCIYPYLKYKELIALPGFHVFDANSWLGRGYHVASVHIDQQEKQVTWPTDKTFDWNSTISFTIPITTPKGCGLYIMNRGPECITPGVPLWWTLRNVPTQKINYKRGNCYVHHGKYFHMISPFDGKDGDRITIQGHAMYCETTQEYWIYW